MSERKIEIRKRYVNQNPKVEGYDYSIDGEQVAASHWDGQKVVTVVAEGWECLFGGVR